MTRIEAAQTFFQTYIDKFFSFEFAVAVGLVCFGEKVETMFPISRAYDNFSTELGKVDANQGRTRLFEAISLGVKMINDFIADPTNASSLVDPEQLICRILCLTDGADNSNYDPYVVFKYLKSSKIILDSIPIGGIPTEREQLYALTIATGGSCFGVSSIDEGLQLFEREAVLSLATRADLKPFAIEIPDKDAFNRTISQPQIMVKKVEKKVDTVQVNKRAVPANPSSMKTLATQVGSGCTKRIFRDLQHIDNNLVHVFL